MILLILLGAVGLYLITFYYKVWKYPRGPFPWPIVGNVFEIDNPQLFHLYLEKMREKYGDVFTFWMFNRPIVCLMRFDVINEALITHGESLNDRTGQFPDTVFQCTKNGGVTFSSGENWREQRRTAIHILRNFGVGRNLMENQVIAKQFLQLAAQIHEQLAQFIDRIKAEPDKDHVLIANIINQLLYGFSYPHNDCKRLMDYVEKLTKVFNGLVESMWSTLAVAFPFVIHLPIIGYLSSGQLVEKYQHCISFVKSDVKDALDDYSKEQEPQCFVQAYYQKMDSNEFLTMEQLYNVCSDFFVAGMETTTTTLRWATLYLAKYPDIQEKIRKEIEKHVGFERLVTLGDKKKLVYTNAFIHELQRVANVFPVNIMRKCKEDVKLIDGDVIPAGAIVLPLIYGALVDEDRFPDPFVFRPERFLNKDKTLCLELTDQTIPFSIGRRQCAGESLARAELFLGIVTMLQKWKFFPSPGQELDLTPVASTIRFPKEQTLRIEEVDSLV